MDMPEFCMELCCCCCHCLSGHPAHHTLLWILLWGQSGLASAACLQLWGLSFSFLSLHQTNGECGWGGWSIVWLIHINCKCSNINILQYSIIANAMSLVVQLAAFWGSHHHFFSGKPSMLLISNAERSGCHDG